MIAAFLSTTWCPVQNVTLTMCIYLVIYFYSILMWAEWAVASGYCTIRCI